MKSSMSEQGLNHLKKIKNIFNCLSEVFRIKRLVLLIIKNLTLGNNSRAIG